MGSIWHSLIWKEWHEHKWTLASIAVILLGVTALAMVSDDRDRFGAAYGMLWICMIPLSVFIGLGTAASERSRGTLPFLQSLPVPMWHVALTKLFAGVLTVAVPIVIAILGFLLWRLGLDYCGVNYRDLSDLMVEDMSPVNLGNWYVNVVVICIGIAGSFFLWSAATGVNRKDEISAGARALSIMIGWSAFLAFFVWTFAGDVTTPLDTWLVTISLSLAPGAAALIVAREVTQPQFVLAAWITASVHVLLAALYVRRFGQVTEREVVSPRQTVGDARRYDWLAPPRRSPLTAIAWKQVRESGPIAVVGVAGVIAVVLLITLLQGSNARPFDTYFAVAASLGSGVALVIGIGVVLHDMGPRLHTFWRSRPIDPDSWFWIKFVTGMVVMLGSLYAPLPVIAAVSQTARNVFFHPDALVLPALHVAAFAAAVAMTCLVRHAVYAAILSVAVLYISVTATWGLLVAAGKTGWLPVPPERLSHMTQAQATLGLMTCFAASTVLAWLAVRNDWGRKSRY